MYNLVKGELRYRITGFTVNGGFGTTGWHYIYIYIKIQIQAKNNNTNNKYVEVINKY